jgi:hypothetical protein
MISQNLGWALRNRISSHRHHFTRDDEFSMAQLILTNPLMRLNQRANLLSF